MSRRTAFLALGATALLAGCGGSSKEDEKESDAPDIAKFSQTFTEATGLKLNRDDSTLWTSLRADGTDGYKRFGSFTVYFPKDDDGREALLGAGAGGGDVKEYGEDVLVRGSGEEGETGRLDQAIRAAVKGDPDLVPAEERPCSATGLDPASGKEGSCRLDDGKKLTVVDSGNELVTPVLKAKVVSTTVAKQLPARTEYSDPERAKGRFVVVRYDLTNETNKPISSVRPNLIIGENTYSESSAAFSLTDYQNNPLPLQPDDSATLTTAFDVPEAVAEDAKETGQLELPAGTYDTSESLSDTDAVGRIRLGGAKTLALGGGSSSSGSSSSGGSSPSSSGGSSSKEAGRKAAAEDALKEFYRALRKGNVKFVCKRLTRAAQQNFGGASSCSQGRIINAAAKAKAPASNVGLRFTTLLTNGQSRALILVRRQNGGFTDTARLARQGNLWRIQGTRRLSGLG